MSAMAHTPEPVEHVVSRRAAWTVVLRETAELLHYNGPIVSDLLRDYGGVLAEIISEDGAKAATVLNAFAALLEPEGEPQEAPEGAETP